MNGEKPKDSVGLVAAARQKLAALPPGLARVAVGRGYTRAPPFKEENGMRFKHRAKPDAPSAYPGRPDGQPVMDSSEIDLSQDKLRSEDSGPAESDGSTGE